MTSTTVEVGPALAQMLRSHEDEVQVISAPGIRDSAASLVSLCKDLGEPVIWPVGASAERLIGAAAMLSEDPLRCIRTTESVTGEQVLLLTVAAAAPFAVFAAAESARRLGAREVFAAGVAVSCADEIAAGNVDWFASLD